MDTEMKRIIIAACLAALSACTAALPEKAGEQSEARLSGETLFSCTMPKTRVTLGDKNSEGYKLFWEKGDELMVYDEAGATLGTAVLVSGQGSSTATFSIPKAIEKGTKVRLVYGSTNVAEEQSKIYHTDYSFATMAESDGLVTVQEGASDAVFKYRTSVIRVNVASSELAGAKIASVILRCEGAELSSSGKDYVRLTLQDSLVLSSTPQQLVFSALPADLTGKEVLLAFRVKPTSGSGFNLPISYNGRALQAGTVNSFEIPALSEDLCSPWYEPHDIRMKEVPTFAYGEANTFLIQCKNGEIYKGATYDPDPDIPGSVAISIKARGDILKVTNPKGATFEWGTFGEGKIYTMRTIGYAESGVDPTKYSFSYDGNYTVTVTNDAAFAGTPILVMKKGGKTLWAWSFWNVAADGTRFGSVKIGDFNVANMDIGQATTQFATWSANADPVQRTVHRYQYGRPWPVFYNQVVTLHFPDNTQEGNIPVIWGPVTLEEFMQNPVGIIANKTPGTELSPYCSDNSLAKAWGACGNETGIKAVFDPCPKGYRVCDRAVYQYLVGVKKSFETNANYPGFYDITSGSLFLRCLYFFARTKEAAGKLQMDGATGTTITWSNFSAGPNTNSASALVLKPSEVAFSAAQQKAVCAPVRCMVDELNR